MTDLAPAAASTPPPAAPACLAERLLPGWALRLAVLVLFGVGALVRLIDLTDPPLDFHPTRQLRNAILARDIYYQMLPDADPARVKQARAAANAVGRYEPPLLETLAALTYRLIGGEQPWAARLFTSVFWLIGGLALFDLARRMTSLDGALVAAGYYLLLPFSIQASRSFQPDPGMVMGFLLAVYGLYRWMESGGWRWTALAGLAGGLAVLTKIVIVYPLAGGAVAAVLTRQGLRKALRDPQVWAMALLMAAPSAVFYLFDNAERASEYFTAWTLALLRLLASPEFYVRWMSFLHGLVSLTIVFLALAGALISAPRHRALLAGLWIGYFLYGLSLPYQMYTHSYYHLQLIPILALGLAPLAQLVLGQAARQGRPVQLLFAGLALVAAAYPAWVGRSILVAEDFRAEPAYWQEVGAALPADGEIVALTQDYGYRLMYYGWRKVDLWPITGEQDLAELRGSAEDFEARFRRYTQGQAYFVVTAFGQYNKQPDLRQRLEKDYPLIAQGDGYLVFDLRAPLTPQP